MSFLGHYLGRTCPWKDCRPGVCFPATPCIAAVSRAYLNDDPATLHLSDEMVTSAAVQLWPVVERRHPLPADVR